VRFTHVERAFLEQNDVGFGRDLPIWFPADHALGGYGQVSNARAIDAGLRFRPLATTVADLLDWFRSLPAERQATLRAGMTRERETELLAAWHARGG
jgi:2'-hydroxyisoflavone reductase